MHTHNLYPYIYTHIHMYTETHTSTHADLHTHTRTHICIYIHTPIHIHTYPHMYMYTHTHTTCIHTYIHTPIHIHTYAHTHTCTHIHTHITCIHTYIYTHTEYKAVFISSEQLRGSGGSWERGLAPDSEGLPGQWWVHRGCTLLPRPPVPRLREAVIAAGPGLPARPRWPEKHLEVLGELQRPSRCSVSSRKGLKQILCVRQCKITVSSEEACPWPESDPRPRGPQPSPA